VIRPDKYLEIWKLQKDFPAPGGGTHVIVEDFNLMVANGELVSIIGHSGCGKSTVLSMVAGLTTCTSGTMILAGKEITGPGLDRGMVFQSPHLLPWLSAIENVLLAIEQGFPRMSKSERVDVARHYLTLVGLEDSCEKRPHELSGGMRQRVGLARAFSLRPKLLLLDEPFGMLDSLTRYELQAILLDLWTQYQLTALMVTHDVDEALYLSDRVVMMTSGPRARVGEILDVPFGRPRDRQQLLDSTEYYDVRERLITFLEQQAHPADAA
jgi:nitrate ABC transporter ATP-binding subunit